MGLSTTPNRILTERARYALQNKWGLAALTTFCYVLMNAAAQSVPKIGQLLSFIISGPMSIGLYTFALSVSRLQEAKLEQILQGFKIFVNAFLAYLLIIIFVLLWALLLIIPGIIAAYSYSMTFFIMAEDPTIEPLDALRKSKEMMQGNKWKLFFLGLRFIGWMLLSVFTLFIGLLWIIPYMNVSIAQFYDDIKDTPAYNAVESLQI